VLNDYNLTMRGRQKTGTSGSFIHIQGPEERKPVLSSSSLSVPSEVVSVDVSGTHFTKMREMTRSHQSVVKKRRGKKKSERPLTFTGSQSGENPFGDEGMLAGDRSDRSCYSEAPTCSDSISFGSSALSQSEDCNPFYGGEQGRSDSDRSGTVTPLPDMELVSVHSSSVSNRNCDSSNPFLDDVVNPFVDYKAPKSYKRPIAIQAENKSPCLNKRLEETDAQSSTSTIFEENNPFFVSDAEEPMERLASDLITNKLDEIIPCELNNKEYINEERGDTTTERYNCLDSLDGLDEVVKELELLALMEQEIDDAEKKVKNARKKPKPDPPKRYSSILQESGNLTTEDIYNSIKVVGAEDSDSVPFCLSVETKRREVDLDRLMDSFVHTDNEEEDKKSSVNEQKVDNQVEDSFDKTNNSKQNERILKAPDVVITNREELAENEEEDVKTGDKAIPCLPDMLTHVTESNVSEVNESPDTSDSVASAAMEASSAEHRLSTSSQSRADSASLPGVPHSGHFRYEAPRLRISEPFSTEEQAIRGRRFDENQSQQICEAVELEQNRWELPDGDTSQQTMEQQWRYCEQVQAGRGSRSASNSEQPDTQDQKKVNNKRSFFKSLKNRLGFSSKSRKTTKNDKAKTDHINSNESLGPPFQFQPDSPRMTSTPLTRSASTRDSRGVSCNVDMTEPLMRISELSDCTKFGGDLPPSYRTAALKNQHQRWSFAAASPSMYQPNPMLDQILAYNNAMHTLPTPYQNTQPYYPPPTTQLPPLTMTRSYSAQPSPAYATYGTIEDRHSLVLSATPAPPSITTIYQGNAAQHQPSLNIHLL